MEQLLLTTFIIIVAFSLLNTVASVALYKSTKEKIYLTTSFFWATLIVNFVLQGQPGNSIAAIIFVYGFNLVPLTILAQLGLTLGGLKLPLKKFLSLYGSSIVLTYFLIQKDLAFEIQAMPLSIATASPLVYTSFQILVNSKEKRVGLLRVFAVVLLFQGIHCINFALFRMQPNAQLWGWPVAYAIYQLIAMILPSIILNYFHIKESDRLKILIDNRTRDLEHVIKQKNNVFKVLAHDIFTPLSVLKLRVDLFRRGKKDANDLAETVDKVVLKVRSLVDQAKKDDEDSKTELDLSMKILSPCQSTEEVLNFMEDKAKDKGINLIRVFNINSSDTIYADEYVLQNSIISNLLTNALKFSSSGSNITVRIDKIDQKDGEKVKICIEDEGIGIPDNLKDNLFSFSTLTTREGTGNEQGHGYGLGIVKRYMDMHKGEIQFESRRQTESLNGFTHFTLTFPVIREQ